MRLVEQLNVGVLIIAFISLIAVQIFVPPFIGIANNGDFARITMLFCYAPEGGWTDDWTYFVPQYVKLPANCWDA
jgi:hypothetical protein